MKSKASKKQFVKGITPSAKFAMIGRTPSMMKIKLISPAKISCENGRQVTYHQKFRQSFVCISITDRVPTSRYGQKWATLDKQVGL